MNRTPLNVLATARWLASLGGITAQHLLVALGADDTIVAQTLSRLGISTSAALGDAFSQASL